MIDRRKVPSTLQRKPAHMTGRINVHSVIDRSLLFSIHGDNISYFNSIVCMSHYSKNTARLIFIFHQSFRFHSFKGGALCIATAEFYNINCLCFNKLNTQVYCNDPFRVYFTMSGISRVFVILLMLIFPWLL